MWNNCFSRLMKSKQDQIHKCIWSFIIPYEILSLRSRKVDTKQNLKFIFLYVGVFLMLSLSAIRKCQQWHLFIPAFIKKPVQYLHNNFSSNRVCNIYRDRNLLQYVGPHMAFLGYQAQWHRTLNTYNNILEQCQLFSLRPSFPPIISLIVAR